MKNLHLCNANQLELHSIINSKFFRRFFIANNANTAGQRVRNSRRTTSARNLHDKRSRDSSASLSHSQRRRRRFRGNITSLVTIRTAISFAFHGVHVTYQRPRRRRSRSCVLKVAKNCMLNYMRNYYTIVIIKTQQNVVKEQEALLSLIDIFID